MSYLARAKMIEDTQLLQRMAACAALEGVVKPEQWVFDNRWELCIGEGWDVPYMIAWNLYENWDGETQPAPLHPGMDETVITDSMILAAVRLLTTSSEPELPVEEEE